MKIISKLILTERDSNCNLSSPTNLRNNLTFNIMKIKFSRQLFENKTDPVFDMIFCVFHNIMKNIYHKQFRKIHFHETISFLERLTLETESRTVSR